MDKDKEREDSREATEMCHTDSLSSHQTAVNPESDTSSKHTLEDQLGNQHLNALPLNKLLFCLTGCSLSLLVSFMDQNGVTVALTYIADELNAEVSINWAGTASLLANTVCQVLFGRFADIFGRKEVLRACLVLLLVSDLLCGFATNGPMFYVFRALAGIGSGGISSLAMVIISDVVTLKQRGKFQGILGASVGIGNAIGPVVMAVFATKYSWRDYYRLLPPLVAAVIVLVQFSVKGTPKNNLAHLSYREKFANIDYLGLFFATAALTLLLIPISGGGSTYAWNSAIVIAMFVVGGVCAAVFIAVELTIPELPMIPLSIFRSLTLSLVLLITFMFGLAYYAFLFVLPYYFQLVRDESIMRSAVLICPLVLTQAFMSTFAGGLISYMCRYRLVLVVGFGIWMVGHCMTIAWDVDTSDGMIVGTLVMIGTGCGFTFQPSIVAAQANCRKSQRAVVISTRNVMRSFGGALGIAFGSLIITNIIMKEIKTQSAKGTLPAAFLTHLKTHIYTRPDISALSEAEALVVRQMYMHALKTFFYFTVPLLGFCFLASIFIRDNGLKCVDEPEPAKEKTEV